MLSTPEGEQPESTGPSSDSFIVHVIDEMPLRVVFAIAFVGFFFAWGGVNTALRHAFSFFGRDPASISQLYGLTAGALTAIALPIVIWRVKRRKR